MVIRLSPQNLFPSISSFFQLLFCRTITFWQPLPIQVANFWNVFDTLSWHFKHWLLHRLVIHGIEVLAIFVLVIFVSYFQEQGCQETSNWTHKMVGSLSIKMRIFQKVFWDTIRIPCHKIAPDITCVNYPVFLLFLIIGTYQPEHLPPNQLIISVDRNKNFMWITKLGSGIM